MTERDGWGFPKSWRISLSISVSYYARCDWSIGLMHDYVTCWDSFFRILVMFEFLETIVIYADAIITVTTSEVLRWLTDSSSIILVPKGHDPLGKHQESRPPSWLDFQIIRYANYSFPLTRRPIIVDFRCWTCPEFASLAADQRIADSGTTMIPDTLFTLHVPRLCMYSQNNQWFTYLVKFKVIPQNHIAHPYCVESYACLARARRQNGGFYGLACERGKWSFFLGN